MYARPLDQQEARRPRQGGPARAVEPDRLAAIDTLTVASLNLHHGVSSSGAPFAVTAAVCQLDAAVICVQEAWQPSGDSSPFGQALGEASGSRMPPRSGGGSGPGLPDQLADAAAKLDMSLRRAVMCTRRSGQLAIALLTALPAVRYEVIELGIAPGDVIPRCAQVALLELPGGARVRVVNTHLTHRFTSPVQLLALQRRLEPGPPTIIVGDLNMPRIIAARWPGYADLVRGRTFPAERPVIQLDHVLASRGISRLTGCVLPPAGSDHLPVRAEICVPDVWPARRRQRCVPSSSSSTRPGR